MKFLIKPTEPFKIESDLLAVFLWEDPKNPWTDGAEKVDKYLSGMIKSLTNLEDFEGREGKILYLNTHGKIPSRQVGLVGLGKKERFSLYVLRKVGASLARLASEKAAKRLAISLPPEWFKDFEGEELSQAIVEGVALGSYKFLKYKTDREKEKKRQIEEIYLLSSAPRLSSLEKGQRLGEIFSQATIFARDLVNEPSSVTTPTFLADLACKLAKNNGFNCKVYEKEEIRKLGMGAFLAVAQGTEEPPKFIRLEYNPPSLKLRRARKIVLVGKGITFDTGGLSLKKQEDMETMKMDMAGAAAILGIFSVIKALEPEAHVIGLIPATENMPSGRAIKPGDVVSAADSKTIEIVNTDAEGRLTLADALSIGAREKPQVMIDLATLTGACIVALGEEIAGLFSTDETLGREIQRAAEATGEKLWLMPLAEEYKEFLKSEVADLKNVSGKKYGGAITAALFLKEFVNGVPWVHLDIAGPAWEEKGTDLIPHGGSGFGARTILKFLMNL